MWKYEKEFRAAHPETIGETDKEYDLDNYREWLESWLAMSSNAVLADVRALLKGIDKTDIEDVAGWWETSTGAEFGAKILDKLLKYLSEHFS